MTNIKSLSCGQSLAPGHLFDFTQNGMHQASLWAITSKAVQVEWYIMTKETVETWTRAVLIPG